MNESNDILFILLVENKFLFDKIKYEDGELLVKSRWLLDFDCLIKFIVSCDWNYKFLKVERCYKFLI